MDNETFVNHLNNYYCSNSSITPPYQYKRASTSHLPDEFVSIGMIKQMLKRQKTSKAAHQDDWPAWISKACAEDLCIPLHKIIYTMCSTSSFPAIWKSGEVVPIPKTNAPATAKEYRPITLLWHLGKIAEKAISTLLRDNITSRLAVNQYAYQSKRSTTDALIAIIDDWTLELDKPGTLCIDVTLLDFSKAFDLVNHETLEYKMSQLNVTPWLQELLMNFLSYRSQSVKHQDALSKYLPQHVGTPQGTILGPILWLIYVDDLQPESVTNIKYADDTTLYRPVKKTEVDGMDSKRCNYNLKPLARNGMQLALQDCQTWCSRTNMQLNEKKTQNINISLTNTKFVDQLSLNDFDIPKSDSVKLLGICIDRGLNFFEHVNSIVTKCNVRIYGLRRLRQVTTEQAPLLRFHESIIIPIIMYASPAWFGFIDSKSMNLLERIQRRCSKIIIPDDSKTYSNRLAQLQIPTIELRLQTYVTNYFKKIAADPDHILYNRLSKPGRRSTRNKLPDIRISVSPNIALPRGESLS
jgi:hypothetical protein